MNRSPRARPARPVRAASVLLLLATLAFLPAATGQAMASIELTATPSPVNPLPGTSGAVAIDMKNTGTVTAYNLRARLSSIDDGVVINRTQEVDLGALGAGDSTSVSPYTFWVPPSTPPGVYHATFILDYNYQSAGTQAGSLTFSATFTVRSPPALHAGPLVPDELGPGEAQVLELTLRNTAGRALSSVQGSWSDPSGTLTPLGQGNQVFLASLAANASVVVPVEVAAPATATAGIYRIDFTFAYTDPSGTQMASAATFAVQVRTHSDLSVALDEWTRDEVSLSVSNVGLGVATAVEVRLLPGGPVDARPSAAVFLGNLQSGDHTTATFSPASPNGRDAPLGVEVAYTDPGGVRRTDRYELPLGDPPRAADDGIGTLAWGGLLAALAVAGGAWFYVRRRRRGA